MTRPIKAAAPGSYADFLHYLDTVTTEAALFSRLTYWFAFRTSPEDVHDRLDLVEARARELKLWNGLELKLERWEQACKEEYHTAGKDAFSASIASDYAAYRGTRSGPQGPRFAPECMQNVPGENVQWLVPELLPLGEVSLLGADGGTGKGIWQAQLIAYVTAGKTSGFFPVPPPRTGRVLIFAGEDDPGRVLRGRLLAAGVDLEKVMVVTSEDYFTRTGSQLCIRDKALEAFVASSDPLLVILDPLQSFLPADVEMASRNQMRGSILPLKSLSKARGLAVLIVMHTNKKQGVSGRGRLADSSDLWDIARSVLMMGRSRTDGKIYLSHEKSSYSQKQQTVLLHIEERRTRPAQTRDDTAAAIRNVLAESRTASMESTRLKSAVMQEIGCGDRTYERAYAGLVKSGEITKRTIRQKDGKNKWYSFLYCGETSGEVRE